MNGKYIITIGREFGSGGAEVGKRLAQRLDVPCYDKELLAMAAKESGYCEELFENHDEKPIKSFLYSVAMGTYSYNAQTKPLSLETFLAQFRTIQDVAKKNSACVFVGRCADYALQGESNVVNVFVHADEEKRIETIVAREGITPKEARVKMQRTDKDRYSYYTYYTDQKWGQAKNYDLCIDSGKLGIDGCVDMILAYIEQIDRA
jgi:cytidylate kinase